MNKWTLTAALILTGFIVSACGTPSGGGGGGPVVANTAAGSTPANTSQTNTTGNSSNSNSNTTNTTNTNADNSNSLTAFQAGQSYGIQVQVPTGWTSHPLKGNAQGDTTGWVLTDPNDSSSKITIAYSACVGCYMGANGQPNLKQVIPVSNATVVSTSADAHTLSYNYSPSGTSNEGWGEIIASNNQSGYAYIDVVLPSSEQTLATSILQSFQFSQ
ncbi:DUF4850 domain-containing protein [Alicyclobacillus sp. TC]|uniref:DUF4850 domain-containing protein n=1 Tax=Alicyclobacillus sp. TC TaxID=2606450 RepID=UPI001933E0F8|nr:DUF4850 domain-containing protein [Alicyclobacillus sp. TC]QRF22712.1 DUF4850 domain-containing protein [Alicyclobacillus sp. TC]